MLILEKIMNERNMTAKELAELSNVSSVSISNILTGKASPRVDTLLKFAEVLNVDIRDLFQSSKNGEPIPIYIKEEDGFKVVGQIKKGSV